jgi:hypothetical protein
VDSLRLALRWLQEDNAGCLVVPMWCVLQSAVQ